MRIVLVLTAASSFIAFLVIGGLKLFEDGDGERVRFPVIEIARDSPDLSVQETCYADAIADVDQAGIVTSVDQGDAQVGERVRLGPDGYFDDTSPLYRDDDTGELVAGFETCE